jgi:hypothetical protein
LIILRFVVESSLLCGTDYSQQYRGVTTVRWLLLNTTRKLSGLRCCCSRNGIQPSGGLLRPLLTSISSE